MVLARRFSNSSKRARSSSFSLRKRSASPETPAGSSARLASVSESSVMVVEAYDANHDREIGSANQC
jgi:hypothetical protein